MVRVFVVFGEIGWKEGRTWVVVTVSASWSFLSITNRRLLFYTVDCLNKIMDFPTELEDSGVTLVQKLCVPCSAVTFMNGYTHIPSHFWRRSCVHYFLRICIIMTNVHISVLHVWMCDLKKWKIDETIYDIDNPLRFLASYIAKIVTSKGETAFTRKKLSHSLSTKHKYSNSKTILRSRSHLLDFENKLWEEDDWLREGVSCMIWEYHYILCPPKRLPAK